MTSRQFGAFVWAVLVAAVLAIGTAAVTADGLTPEQKLKAENLQLKIQLAQAKATIADREQRIRIYEIALGQAISGDAQKDGAALSAEQVKLVEEFRATLHAKADEVFDWDSLSFKKPQKTEDAK